MSWEHGEICDCGTAAGIHEGIVSPLGQFRYEANCPCGWRSQIRSSGDESLALVGDHVMNVEACGCACHTGTQWPRYLRGRGEESQEK